ncbi:MAG: DUF1624 domain-containing protein [Oscillospiraceae bacterium]|nr:DUF1624 domain-containing protein [Oscillospiraceae bacterium]
MENAKGRERIAALDIMRGCALIYVMLYHLMYDLRFMFGVDTPSVLTPGNAVFEIFHTLCLITLFTVSGICTRYSRDSVRRGAVLCIAGFLITAGTELFMPSELIVFGVISCFGACMAITGLLKKPLSKLPVWTAPIFFLLWAVFENTYKTGEINLFFTTVTVHFPEVQHLYPIGITGSGFYSADYFPLIPWLFLFLTGFALFPAVDGRKLPGGFYRMHCRPLEFIGRHSLWFYALHQPLFLGGLAVILG